LYAALQREAYSLGYASGKAFYLIPFITKSLNVSNALQALLHHYTRFGQLVLGLAGECLNPAAKYQGYNSGNRYHAEHQQGEPWGNEQDKGHAYGERKDAPDDLGYDGYNGILYLCHIYTYAVRKLTHTPLGKELHGHLYHMFVDVFTDVGYGTLTYYGEKIATEKCHQGLENQNAEHGYHYI
jgi:hypothetical protein